jgi:ligand-binding sensor domain-containing protein
VLRRSAVTGGKVTTVLDGVSSLLRPQFTRAGELFAVGVQNGQQRMWVTTPDGETRAISASDVFSQGRVMAFRISPDGARMALVMKAGGKTQLATARVLRSPKLVVDGWRLLETDSPLTDAAVIDARDLAWTSATELVVLGADRADGSYGQTAVSVDASTVQTQLKTSDWEAVELAVLLRTQTAITLVRARDGAAYRDEGNRWVKVLDDTQAIAYPG